VNPPPAQSGNTRNVLGLALKTIGCFALLLVVAVLLPGSVLQGAPTDAQARIKVLLEKASGMAGIVATLACVAMPLSRKFPAIQRTFFVSISLYVILVSILEALWRLYFAQHSLDGPIGALWLAIN
jgi:hypothetical protein